MSKHFAQTTRQLRRKDRSAEGEPGFFERHFPGEDLFSRIAQPAGKHPVLTVGLPLLMLAAIHFLPVEGWMIPTAYAIPFLFAAASPILIAVNKLRERDYLSNEVFTSLSGVLLFLTGAFAEAVLLPILFAAAQTLELRLSEKSREEMHAALDFQPRTARVVLGKEIDERSPYDVEPGEILLVPAGERVPLDGIVVEGISTIDTASVSGQRSPWAVNEGYRVYAGCLNLTSDIKIKALRPFDRSTATRLLRISREAESFCSEQEQLARRFISFFVLGVSGLGLVVSLLVPLFRGMWVDHLRRGAVLLLTAGPAAEAFALPLAYRRGLVLAIRSGIFSKGEDCFESLAKADTFIFDKSGTITEGRYTVTDVYPWKMSEHQLLTIAAAAECRSRHPIAAALREAAGKLDEKLLASVEASEAPGLGVSATIGGRQILVGNAEYLQENKIRCAVPSRPGTAVHVALEGHYCGHILVNDKVRRRAFDAMEGLRVNGVQKLVMLTGDLQSVARPIASKLNFDILRAELKPDGKASAVAYLVKNKGERACVAYVGDGAGSGKAMSMADVGIAMGALGSEASLSGADVLIMDRDIMKLPQLVTLSKTVFSVGMQNTALSAAVSLLVAVLGLFGLIPPLAAELMVFAATVLVLCNTLRIRRKGR